MCQIWHVWNQRVKGFRFYKIAIYLFALGNVWVCTEINGFVQKFMAKFYHGFIIYE